MFEKCPDQSLKEVVHLTLQYIQQEYGIGYSELKQEEGVIQKPLIPNPPKISVIQKVEVKEEEKVLVVKPKSLRNEVVNFSEIKKVILSLFPSLPLKEGPPSDEIAKKMKESWKKEILFPDIVILSFNENPNERDLLQNISKALNQHGLKSDLLSFSTSMVEALLKDTKINLIITTGSLWQVNALQPYLKESIRENLFYLNKVPVFKMQPLHLYLEQPSLKRPLWQSLKEILKI